MSLEHLDPGSLAKDCNSDKLYKHVFQEFRIWARNIKDKF